MNAIRANPKYNRDRVRFVPVESGTQHCRTHPAPAECPRNDPPGEEGYDRRRVLGRRTHEHEMWLETPEVWFETVIELGVDNALMRADQPGGALLTSYLPKLPAKHFQ